MNRLRTFQILVVAATVCYVVWFFLPFWSNYLTDIEHRVASHTGYGALLPIDHPLYHGTWFALSLIAALGLIFIQNWARHLYLALSILGLVSAPFSGFVIQPPLDTLFSSASLLLDGAILAIAYLSPLAASFSKTARDDRQSKKQKR